jgi:hypothetical protein
LEESAFQFKTYVFQDEVKVNIYGDLYIDFQEIIL